MMNNKLRLIVTDKCHNRCPLCCNNRFDLSQLPIVDRWDYDEIMFTGGEPMLKPHELTFLVRSIRKIHFAMGHKCKYYLYTALPFIARDTLNTLMYFSGICVTPHTQRDVDVFVELNQLLMAWAATSPFFWDDHSLRLNLFPESKAMLPEDIDLSLWSVKDMRWIKDCPVPEGEDLRRISQLY